METSDKIRKLSRYDLVELIYRLRKENLELKEKLEEAEARAEELERNGSPRSDLEDRIFALERLLHDLQDHMDDVSGQKKSE